MKDKLKVKSVVKFLLFDDYVPKDFVKVAGATIKGQVADSEVFIEGRTVKIENFCMCDHPVTQKEYEEYCTYGNYKPSKEKGKGADYPAYDVSWYDAIVYCNKRSRKEGLTPCYTIKGSTNPDNWGKVPDELNGIWNAVECNFNANGYRLPTEAEWEYAARGGNGLTGKQYKYAGSDNIDEVAWYKDNSGGTNHEVKNKKPNSLGLYDMSGNVCEWCWDWNKKIDRTTPVTGSSSGSKRNMRGGSWSWSWDITTLSYRNYDEPHTRWSNVGFRVVRTAT